MEKLGGAPFQAFLYKNHILLRKNDNFLGEEAMKGKLLLILVVTAVVLLSFCCKVEAGLVAYWNFDEGSGSTVHDYAGANVDDGTIIGAKWVDGVSGQALSFDGVDDYVEVANSADLNPNTGITLSAWVKPDVLGNYNTIVSKYWWGDGYYLRLSGIYDGTSIEFTGYGQDGEHREPANIPIGSWSHIAGTFDGTYTAIYLNGQLLGSGQIVWPGTATTTVPLRIGVWPVSATLPFAGTIDEVRIYDRPLTQAEVQALVPEPATVLLLGLGGLIIRRLKFKKRVRMLNAG